MTENWLPITDYSAKYKVSVSTLRRRIKAEDIKYRFIEGKYLLLDEPVTTHPLHRPSLSDSTAAAVAGTTEITQAAAVAPAPPQPVPQSASQAEINAQLKKAIPSENFDGPILSAANRLLNELKKAYTQILQEKEEQILQLREEVTDLKTLVRVLEGENDKLNSRDQRVYRREIEI